EELRALLREAYLRLGRELLAEAAHGLARRARRDRVPLGEHDVVGAEEREVVCDRRADGAGAGDDYARHAPSCGELVTLSLPEGSNPGGSATTRLAGAACDGTVTPPSQTEGHPWSGARSSARRARRR